VLGKRIERSFAAIGLTALLLALIPFQINGITSPGTSVDAAAATTTSTASYAMDKFGVAKIYPTTDGGNEWYVNMNDPRNDPDFRNLGNVHFSKNSDGSWQIYADQIRMEAWSPENQKWRNVEITEYAKIESGSNELLQMYSRGGHHTSRDPCLGSAYKARLYGDGTAAWNKEITHPAYAGNRGVMSATTDSLEGRWIGFKAVIYNFVGNDGNSYVRLESYIDDDVTDSDGNLIVKNNWKLASVYEDKGGWATSNSDFDSNCGRDRDEILTSAGGNPTQNIAAFRSDDLTWSFKYLSVREIDPILTQQDPDESSDNENSNSDNEETGSYEIDAEQPNSGDSQQDTSENSYLAYPVVAGQHLLRSNNTITTISGIDIPMDRNAASDGKTVAIALAQNGKILATDSINVSELNYGYYSLASAKFQSIDVVGSFDILVLYDGSAKIATYKSTDLDIPGNYFDANRGELEDYDLSLWIM